MDPNAVLQIMLDRAGVIMDAVDANADVGDIALAGLELAEAVQNLNEWLVGGGFLPRDWDREKGCSYHQNELPPDAEHLQEVTFAFLAAWGWTRHSETGAEPSWSSPGWMGDKYTFVSTAKAMSAYPFQRREEKSE